MTDIAPIIVFCYNRPEHLRKTMNWLRANKHAEESPLYVFCDGPKVNASEEQLQKIAAARAVVDELAVVPAFKEVHILKRDENLGLGTSIITGVTEVIVIRRSSPHTVRMS
jgi:GT2 family glycosyltransferase